VVELALKASGPLIADLQAGSAFSVVSGSGRDDDGGPPFPDMVTRTWVKELKHRRMLLEG
jgi:serine/threonine-protein kinase HipA